MTNPNMKTRDSRMLEALLDPEFEQRRTWHPEELGSILEHQWNVPLTADLGGMPPDRSQMLARLCDADGLLLKSYGDIFRHPMPPIELLQMIKDYAKRNMAAGDRGLPEEIAQLLYVLSVAVARVRCGQRITTQSDDALRANIETVLAQPWVTPPVVTILREALTLLVGSRNTSEENDAPRAG